MIGTPLVDRDLETLIQIGKIPAPERVRFQILVQCLIGQATESRQKRGSFGTFEQQSKKFQKISRFAERLLKELRDLNANDRFVLGCYHYTNMRFPHAQTAEEKAKIIPKVMGENEISSTFFVPAYGQLIDDAESIHAAASLHNWRKKAAGGAPSKSPDVPFNPNASPFDGFVGDVMAAVCSCGGNLVAYRSETVGSMNKFLDVLRDYMPPDFIPPFQVREGGVVPGQARLARLVARAKREDRQQ